MGAPKYVLLFASDTPGGFQPAGTEFEFDGLPNNAMQPLNDEAREKAAEVERLRVAALEASAPLVPGMTNAAALALTKLVADAVVAALKPSKAAKTEPPLA